MPEKDQQSVLWDNLLWNTNLFAIQIGHAKLVRGRARSGYYKAAYLQLSSVAEALACILLEKKLSELSAEAIPLDDWKCKNSHMLPSDITRDGVSVSICQRYQPRFVLTDKTEFSRINRMCQTLGIITPKLYDKLEDIRKKRNKIHLKSLLQVERSWNKQDVKEASKVVAALIEANKK